MGPHAGAVSGGDRGGRPAPLKAHGPSTSARTKEDSARAARASDAAADDAVTADGKGIYIRQAAHLVGASAVQLRTWEQQQLITPARTLSGYRVYSMADIERMRRIQSLAAAGVNAAGMRRILDGSVPTPHNGNAADVTPARSVGQTIRDLRRRRGLSLREVSDTTGLSASYISSLERGAAAPSIASLQRLGAAFETNAISLMSGSYEAPDSLVVRLAERRVLESDHGVRIEDLSTAGSNLEPLIFTFEPGGGSDGAISHEGEEFLLVMSGRLHLRLDGSDDYFLETGDSMSFRSERAHQFGNHAETPTTVLWINTPRTF